MNKGLNIKGMKAIFDEFLTKRNVRSPM